MASPAVITASGAIRTGETADGGHFGDADALEAGTGIEPVYTDLQSAA